MSWPDFGRLPKELATVGPSWLTSDHYFEAEPERPLCRQVVAGPRFEPATEAPANGFHGRPVDHCPKGQASRIVASLAKPPVVEGCAGRQPPAGRQAARVQLRNSDLMSAIGPAGCQP